MGVVTEYDGYSFFAATVQKFRRLGHYFESSVAFERARHEVVEHIYDEDCIFTRHFYYLPICIFK